MSEQISGSIVTESGTLPQPPAMHGWWPRDWTRALIPTVGSFEWLISGAPGNLVGAYSWVAFCTALDSVISLPISIPPRAVGTDTHILGAAFLGLGSILAVSLSAHFAAWGGRLTGGRGTYQELAYVFSLFLAPLALLDGLITGTWLPGVLGFVCSCVSLLLIVYELTLFSVAVRVAHRIHWVYCTVIGMVAYMVFLAMQFGVGMLLGLGLAASGVR